MKRSLFPAINNKALLFTLSLFFCCCMAIAQTPVSKDTTKTSKHSSRHRVRRPKHKAIIHQSSNDKELQQVKDEKNRQKGIK